MNANIHELGFTCASRSTRLHTRHAQESAFVYFLFQASLILVYLPKYDKGATRAHAYLLISDAKWCGSALLARGVLAKLPPQFKSWPFFRTKEG